MNLSLPFSILLVTLVASELSAQDTIETYNTPPAVRLWTTDENNLPLLQDKNFIFNSKTGDPFFQLLSAIPNARISNGVLTLPTSFTIQNCTFSESSEPLFTSSSLNLRHVVAPQKPWIYACTFKKCPHISCDADSFQFSNSHTDIISFLYSKIGDLSIVGNTFEHPDKTFGGFLSLDYLQCRTLGILSNIFDNKYGEIDLHDSRVESIYIYGENGRNMHLIYGRDSIMRKLDITVRNYNENDKDTLKQRVDFATCFIDGDLFIDVVDTLRKNYIKFNTCTFGSHIVSAVVRADTIEFENCLNIQNAFKLNAISSNGPTYLKIVSSDVSKIQFDYLGSIKLYVWKDNPQLNIRNYQNLIQKFKIENDEQSLENISVEYFRYRNNPITNFLVGLWWYYGYKRGLVLLWTLFFLIVFFLINLRIWPRLREMYPIITPEPDVAPEYQDSPQILRRRKLVTVLTFTTMVFFSLKLEFTKLSFKRPGMVIYFFIQWVIGLGCLFFIVNAILKL